MRNKLLIIFGAVVVGIVALGSDAWSLHHHDTKEIPPLETIKSDYISCIGLSGDEIIAQCLDDLSARTYGNYPTKDIAAILDTLTYPQKNHWCHEIMHYMGWKAYSTEGDIADAFLNSSELCDSGMYHGVMEEYLRREGFTTHIEELISTACTDALSDRPDISNGMLALCYHGLGHGLMYVTSSDIERSLEYCDVLEGEAIGDCYGGVFMEYNVSKELGPISNQRELTDFSYCEGLKEKHRTTCYFRQGLNNFAATGDVQEAMELCLQVPEERQLRCFDGVGANNPSPGKSHADAGKDCAGALEISNEAYRSCIRGSLGFVLQLEWGDTNGALQFCNEITDAFKDFCYHETGQAIQPWVTATETSEKKCSVFPTPDAQALCVAGEAGT